MDTLYFMIVCLIVQLVVGWSLINDDLGKIDAKRAAILEKLRHTIKRNTD